MKLNYVGKKTKTEIWTLGGNQRKRIEEGVFMILICQNLKVYKISIQDPNFQVYRTHTKKSLH